VGTKERQAQGCVRSGWPKRNLRNGKGAKRLDTDYVKV